VAQCAAELSTALAERQDDSLIPVLESVVHLQELVKEMLSVAPNSETARPSNAATEDSPLTPPDAPDRASSRNSSPSH
jgi:hypothetical protein